MINPSFKAVTKFTFHYFLVNQSLILYKFSDFLPEISTLIKSFPGFINRLPAYTNPLSYLAHRDPVAAAY
jgi:hypothetical protein